MFTLGNNLRRLGTALLDFIYPLHCQGCEGPLETSEVDLCTRCWKEILSAAAGPARTVTVVVARWKTPMLHVTIVRMGAGI